MKPTKYKSVSDVYNGYKYDSKLEASYAMQLDWLIKAKEIEKVKRQFKIDLTIAGVHICNYFIDFKVFYVDGHIEYHEVKGFETDVWRIKWKLSQAIYPEFKFVLIK
jgi:hypothetical protein